MTICDRCRRPSRREDAWPHFVLVNDAQHPPVSNRLCVPCLAKVATMAHEAIRAREADRLEALFALPAVDPVGGP